MNNMKLRSENRLFDYLLEESNNTIQKDAARGIAKSVVSSLDFNDNYVAHKSMRQRAKDILPSVKSKYFVKA